MHNLYITIETVPFKDILIFGVVRGHTLWEDFSLSLGAVLASLHELAVLGDLLRLLMSLELTELLSGLSGTSGLLVAWRSRGTFPLLFYKRNTSEIKLIATNSH